MAKRKHTPIDLPHLFAVSMELSKTVEYGDATLALIAKAAKIPVERLREEFVDFTHYLIAIQQRFLDELRSEVIAATAHIPPGLARIRGATLVYLDHCLKHHDLRGWMVQARREQPLIAEGLRRQNHSFGLIISTEFHALRWPHPLAAARLYLAAINEVARMEQTKGEVIPHLRDAIWDIARFYTGAVNQS